MSISKMDVDLKLDAGLDLAKVVWEKPMILVQHIDYGYEKSLKKSVFTVFVVCKKIKQSLFHKNFPPEALLENITKNVSWSIVINR